MKAASYANDVLDQSLNGGASGTFVVGGTTYTLPLKLRFLSTLSTATTAGTEFVGGSYPAGGVSLAGAFGTAATAQAKANTAAVTVTNAPATTWADVEIVDSTATPKRMNFKGTPSFGKTINVGDSCTVAIGALAGAET